MDLEKLERRVTAIVEKLDEFGYDMREDFDDLLDQEPELKEVILNNKLKKIEYFHDKENNRVGLLIANLHITFEFTYGEDEGGPWYEVDCHILDINTGDE